MTHSPPARPLGSPTSNRSADPCHVGVTPRPSPAAPARHRRARRRSLTCGNATDHHRGTPSHPPSGSLTIHKTGSPAVRSARTAWATTHVDVLAPLAGRRATRRDAPARQPHHHQGPLAGRLVPVPRVNGPLVAALPHSHPTGPAGVGSGRGDHRATPLGERSPERVRLSAHATSRHARQCDTHSYRCSRAWSLPRESQTRSAGWMTFRLRQTRRCGNRAHKIDCGSTEAGDAGLRLSPGPSPTRLARVLAIPAVQAESPTRPTRSRRRTT